MSNTLRQDQEIFNILLEAVSEGILIVDKNQKIVEINSNAETIFGYEPRELIQQDLNKIIPFKFHSKHGQYFEKFLKSGKRRSMGEASDIFGLKKNGVTIAIEVELNPYAINDKLYVMALVKDISERKEIERNLMLKSTALQSASSGIIITDALKEDHPIIYFNTAFETLTGYSSDEILNRNCRFLQGEDRDQEGLKTIRKAISKKESCRVKLRNYKKDGTLFFNDLYIIPIIDNNGVLTNYIGIQNDITQIKTAEEERDHLVDIIEDSLNEIFVFDAHTFKFINANLGARKNLGYSLEELQEMTPADLKLDYTEEKFKDTVSAVLDRKVEKLQFEAIHKRKNGTTYPIEIHLQLHKLGERKVFVSIVLDVTERKNYTKKLEKTVNERTEQLKIALSKEKELNELKTKFLSLVSHEFKTPLSGILTSSVLLSKYKLSEEQPKREKHIKIIGDKIQYLNSILNDFLSLERLESGKLNYNFNNFKLSKVIDEVIYNANMLLKEGQSIKYPENIDDYSLYHDEKTTKVILSNLVNNAIMYSPEHTSISIVVNQDDYVTTIEVKDQGIGIPLKDQKNIFDRYYRAENVSNSQGTGIGLNIVKNHLENLGGTINFTSKANKGTTFVIRLPNKAKE